jgi:hypothetical protein
MVGFIDKLMYSSVIGIIVVIVYYITPVIADLFAIRNIVVDGHYTVMGVIMMGILSALMGLISMFLF